MAKNTVTINGNVYDVDTGDILQASRHADHKSAMTADELHEHAQRSQTLQHRYVIKSHAGAAKHQANRKKLTVTERKQPTIVHHTKHTPVTRQAQSSQISHFPKSQPRQIKRTPVSMDIAPTKHRLQQQAQIRQAQSKQQRAALPSQVIKQTAINDATSKMSPRSERKEVKQETRGSRWSRFLSIGSAALAVLLVGAYFTYINMPSLSTRVAAAQAGINATYPSYQPSGYSLNGPVAYEQGSVIMKFAANGTSNDSFTLAQTQSSWDSSAVLENYVKPKSDGRYTTSLINGLTVYSYGTNAAWVNGGILYTVNGNAALSPVQVQKLATSL